MIRLTFKHIKGGMGSVVDMRGDMVLSDIGVLTFGLDIGTLRGEASPHWGERVPIRAGDML